MKRHFLCLLCLLLSAAIARPYNDYRGHNLDSLERAVAKWDAVTIEHADDEQLKDLVRAWADLREGYQPLNTSKCEYYARKGLALSTRKGWYLSAAIQAKGQSFAGESAAGKVVRLSRAKDGAYCHNVVITEFKGALYAQWQCSDRDEDAADTRIYYSQSRDGRKWSRPRRLPVGISGVRFIANGGWWQSADSLTCFVNVTALDGGKSCMYVRSSDGKKWTAPKPVTTSGGTPILGIIEQDLRALPGGRILTAFHVGPDMICTPYYTDDPSALSGWTAGKMNHLPYPGKSTSREIEPSWYIAPGSCEGGGAVIVMLFRDQAGSFRKLESVSRDGGETWTTPALTNVEDSRSKQSAGNLPDGRAFMVWNPSNSKDRWPLVIAVSQAQGGTHESNDSARIGRDSAPQTVTDSISWARTILLDESDIPPMRRDGLYKHRGFSYPKSFIFGGCIYIGFAMNKEDACVLRLEIPDWETL